MRLGPITCPGWPAGQRTAKRPAHCGADALAVAAVRRGGVRLVCDRCGRYWWTRIPNAAARVTAQRVVRLNAQAQAARTGRPGEND